MCGLGGGKRANTAVQHTSSQPGSGRSIVLGVTFGTWRWPRPESIGSDMEQSRLNWIANFIWGIADDVLRDLYVRGKYRDAWSCQ